MEQVDVGEEKPRTVVSGLVKYMKAEELAVCPKLLKLSRLHILFDPDASVPASEPIRGTFVQFEAGQVISVVCSFCLVEHCVLTSRLQNARS